MHRMNAACTPHACCKLQVGQKLDHQPRLPGYHPQVGLQLDNLRLDPGEEMRLGPAARAALSHARDQWARGLPPSLPAVRASLRLGGHGYDVLEALLQRIDTPVGGVVGGGAGGAGSAGGAVDAVESFAAAAAAVASLENWLLEQASKSKCKRALSLVIVVNLDLARCTGCTRTAPVRTRTAHAHVLHMLCTRTTRGPLHRRPRRP